MNIHHIRNATAILDYGGKKFLIDPMLAEKGTLPPFISKGPFPSPRKDQMNPLVDLPMPVEDIINGIDAVIVTHLHLDHWDDIAKEVLPKEIKLFVQDENDANEIRLYGFKNVEVLREDTVFESIQLVKTKGKHGRGEILNYVGNVCGIVFKHSTEKTLYFTGDTVWYEAVKQTIDQYNPEIIVANAGDNHFLVGESLIMGKDDLYELHKAIPDSTIIAVHMEAVNHWGLSREELKSFNKEKGISEKVLVPEDGDNIFIRRLYN